MNRIYLYSCLVLCIACRKGVVIPRAETEMITGFSRAAPPDGKVRGLYLLNEGNMNMNKASLDYLDLLTGQYNRRVFSAYNPEITRGLGDVGNYIATYGSKMYLVINNSNKVEVVDANTVTRIRQINVNQCRYIDFYKDKAYITSNDGFVAVVDTSTLEVEAKIPTGRNPEQLVVVGNKLYVANSGGYSPPNYEKTISVINLDTQQEIRRIEAGINLHRMAVDAYGDLYVTSRGDYYDVPSKVFIIDTHTDKLKQTLHIAASNLYIHKDLAYIYSVEWSYITSTNTISYTLLNVKDETILDRSFITDGTEKQIRIPYGIAVDPETEDVFVTDAKDYVTPGTLHCYDKNGKHKWSVMTGDIPAHFTFLQTK